MTQHLLVALPDEERLPVGRVIGVYEVVEPRRYAAIDSEPDLVAWMRDREMAVPDCGHLTPAQRRVVRKQVERNPIGARPPGVVLRSDGEARIRVWPSVEHAGASTEELLWESPVDVVRAPVMDPRRRRSARRGRWHR